jgi:hypothetical protein
VLRRSVWLGLVFSCLVWSRLAAADPFAGTFGAVSSDGQSVLELSQRGGKVTGTYSVGPTHLTITGNVVGGRVEGSAVLEGTPVRFAIVLRVEGDHLAGEITELDGSGKPDPYTTEKIVFNRTGGAPATGPAAGPASGRPATRPSTAGGDRGRLDTVAGRVKTNFAGHAGNEVLAAGQPPLTRDSVAAFAELLRLTFGVELTEAEYAETVNVFITYYNDGDPGTRQLLSTGWQSILGELRAAKGEAQQKAIAEVRGVLEQRFAAGATAGIPWAVSMNATLQKRTSTVATMKAPVPTYAKKAELHQQMTEADLEASLEMLYFMWVAAGRDAALVTPDAVAMVRQLIVQNFPTFPPQVQLMFANGQKVYAAVRGQWAQASQGQRVQLARQFSISLDQLGLTVPRRGGDGRIHADGAWSDMNGKSHGEWAGEMVQGLAGSSYKSSW